MLLSYACLIPLAAALLTLGLAIVVLRTGQHAEPARAFVFLATALVFWNLNFFILYSVSDHDLALSLTRVLRVGGLFAPPAIFHLALSLRSQRHPAWRKALLLDYGFTCGIVALNAFDLVVADLQRVAGGYQSVGTRFYDLFSLSVFGNFSASILLLGA